MENPSHIERDEERERPEDRRDTGAPEGAESGERRSENAGAAPEGRPVERDEPGHLRAAMARSDTPVKQHRASHQDPQDVEANPITHGVSFA